MSKPSPKRPITNNELAAIHALDGVGMLPASWDKRFRREVLCNAEVSGEISEKAAAQLWRLFIRYRRQISASVRAELMRIAKEKAAPDFRKQNAAANEQARIDELKRKYGRAMHT